eukprot:5417688-Pleurochrysis_carterae.AAC.1
MRDAFGRPCPPDVRKPPQKRRRILKPLRMRACAHVVPARLLPRVRVFCRACAYFAARARVVPRVRVLCRACAYCAARARVVPRVRVLCRAC